MAFLGSVSRLQAPSTSVRDARCSVQVRAAVKAAPVSIPMKKLDGSDSGNASIGLRVADADTSTGVVHRYITLVRQNMRQGSASTLTRSEVRGGGKKPYNQKGTGGARRGTQRTPLRPGGGQLFGPKPRDYTISMNKKERRLALSTALQSAAANNMIAIEDTSSWSEMKTSTLVKTLKACGADPMADDEKRVLMIVGAFNDALFMAGRNIAKLDMCTTDNLNIFAVLKASKIVVDEKALAILSEYFGENGEAFKSHYELE